MTIVFLLVPVTLILVGVGLWGFFWAVGSGQFDELDAAAWEILVEEKSQDPCLPHESRRP